MENPFKTYEVDGRWFYAVGAEDRLAKVKGFDLAQCEAALRVGELQKTVQKAIERRQRRLRAAAATAPSGRARQ